MIKYQDLVESRCPLPPSRATPEAPLLPNPKSSSLASILATVVATGGGDSGAYPSEAVGSRGVSRPQLMGAGGHRWRALGGDCYGVDGFFTVQLGTPRGRYDEYSSKFFPQKETKVCQSRKKLILQKVMLASLVTLQQGRR
jgi:hypothetical protein